MIMIKIARIYESYEMPEFYRILVDRVWPRGVSKQKARLFMWAKDIAPSKELREWFNHEDEKFDDFRKKYLEELRLNPKTFDFVQEVQAHEDIVLLYAAKNKEHNQAVVLQEYLKSLES
ncbi:DUF488 domain-containing protein [Companilactobacillus sp. DQM5]|uniref:DUF488 domain-containing protein n=1 Tax=Companilactobacillus sp. DQM5 TaxID=3463359 RepID=UPI0040591720